MRDPNEFRDEVYRRAEKQRKSERRRLSAVLGCVAIVAVAAVSAHAFAPLTAKDTADYANKGSAQYEYAGNTMDIALPESSQFSAQTLMIQIEQNDICMPSVNSFDDYDSATDYFTQISRKQASDFSGQGFTEEYFSEGGVIFIIMEAKMSGCMIDIGESEERVTVNINASFDDNNSQKYLLCVPSPKVNGRHVSLLINGTVFN